MPVFWNTMYAVMQPGGYLQIFRRKLLSLSQDGRVSQLVKDWYENRVMEYQERG
jgi:hypothetical protein